MKSMTIIIPMHNFEETLLKRAFKSITTLQGAEKNKVTIVGPEDVLVQAEKLYNETKCPLALTTIVNDETDVFTQINKAVYACTTKFFTILEYDDYFDEKWFKFVDEYLNNKNEIPSSLYMPLVRVYNKEGNYVGLLNEVMWASSFSDEIGVFDKKSLLAFTDFNVTGSVIKTEDFISVGGLKPSLKIASMYEFLLRMCENGKRCFVVPRIGYHHMLGRDGSYLAIAKEKITQKEGEFLLETARQEFYHKEDRNKTFEE